MSKPSSPTYKTTNWRSYTEALKLRGSLTIWFDPEMRWEAKPSGKRGRQQSYSDTAIQTCLTMKVLFGMALRQTTGFVASLLKLIGLDWAVPDFSTLCRRQKELVVNIPYRGSDGPLHLLVDSTGIKAEGGVTQAKSPPHLIEGALPTEGAIAHVLVSKYADHLPLYRQSQIYKRSGLDLHRSTLAGWVGKASFHVTPVVDRMAAILKTTTKLFMDETTAPVLDPGRGKTKTGYLWALARDDRGWGGEDPPGVIYFYADGRGGIHAEEFLAGFKGILQVDGYAGYNRLTKNTRADGSLTLAFCWAHARRKLKEVHDRDGSEIAAESLRRIAEFYKIEAEIRGTSSGQRLTARQTRTKPLMDDFGLWLRDQRSRISAKSRLGEKLAYISRQWEGLQIFLTDGRVEIDSNPVERTIRPIALNRKNALFAGHDEGGKSWGRIASLIETCKMNDIEPFAYLKVTLEAIASGHPTDQIDDLMPWAFNQASS
jgi:hypothetical protein